MKTRNLFTLLISIFLSIFLFSCGSTPAQEDQKDKETIVKENYKESIELEKEADEVILIDEVIKDVSDEEYLRSIDNIDKNEVVSKEEFEDDKATILGIIDDLAKIMDDQDVQSWLKYVSPDSIRYYSDPKNIRKAQKKLPDKTIQLYGIGDYFKFVFIPARKNKKVEEIRYISKTYVKAVQVKADNSTTVYYYFNKINGKWLVHIPTL